MTRHRAACLIALLVLATACHDPARGGRRAIRVVGSSTMFSLTAAVAERFAQTYPDALAPVVESTGTGGGLRLFCAGVGAAFPDVADASRRMTRAEYGRCAANGAGALLEVEIGRDAVVFARAAAAPALPLTPALLYRALAAAPDGTRNASRTWRDLDASLPATPIRVFGPPATSGTRELLLTRLFAKGCRAVEGAAVDPARCTRLREDGAYLDAGENDATLIGRLRADPAAVGVLGHTQVEAAGASVQALALDGVRPTRAAIADGRYEGTRPLFLYVKLSHLAAVPGLSDWLRLYAASWSPGGALARRGLVPASAATRARSAAVIARSLPLDPAMLP